MVKDCGFSKYLSTFPEGDPHEHKRVFRTQRLIQTETLEKIRFFSLQCFRQVLLIKHLQGVFGKTREKPRKYQPKSKGYLWLVGTRAL